jgi:hypothetical protein
VSAKTAATAMKSLRIRCPPVNVSRPQGYAQK